MYVLVSNKGHFETIAIIEWICMKVREGGNGGRKNLY